MSELCAFSCLIKYGGSIVACKETLKHTAELTKELNKDQIKPSRPDKSIKCSPVSTQ